MTAPKEPDVPTLPPLIMDKEALERLMAQLDDDVARARRWLAELPPRAVVLVRERWCDSTTGKTWFSVDGQDVEASAEADVISVQHAPRLRCPDCAAVVEGPACTGCGSRWANAMRTETPPWWRDLLARLGAALEDAETA